MKKCLLFLCILVSINLNAVTYVYTGTGSWTDVANWNIYPTPSGGLVTLNPGDLVQVPFGSDLTINVGVLNTGFFEIYGNATNNSNFTNAGTVFVFGTFAENSNFTNIGSVKASGIYGGNLENEGVLQPRGPAGSVERLDLFGDLNQDPDGEYMIEIKGAGGEGAIDGHSITDVWGAANFDGTLKIVLDGYDPLVGDEFRLMTYFSKTGTFSTLDLPDISPKVWDVDYNAGDLTLKVDAAVPHRSMNLEAHAMETAVKLNWTDQNEEYSKFTIQHSMTNEDWKSIGEVSSTHELEYLDLNPESGYNYYRILALRHDGLTDFSEVRSVDFSSSLELSFYPNPVHDYLNIRVGHDNGQVFLISSNGQVVKSVNMTRDLTLNVQDVDSGMYHLVYETDAQRKSYSIVINH